MGTDSDNDSIVAATAGDELQTSVPLRRRAFSVRSSVLRAPGRVGNALTIWRFACTLAFEGPADLRSRR